MDIACEYTKSMLGVNTFLKKTSKSQKYRPHFVARAFSS